MKIDITADTMKEGAAAYIADQIGKHSGIPDRKAYKILAPIMEAGEMRDLVILLMCGYAAHVVETALTLAAVERERR